MYKVELVIPAIVDQLYPQTALHTLRLLERAGCSVQYNPLQTSCGLEAYDAGFWEEAKVIGTRFLRDFNGQDFLVSPSLSDVGMVKDGYNDLFTNATDHNRCRQIQRHMFDISDFLVNVVNKIYFGAEFDTAAIFHPACSRWSGYRVRTEPYLLLKQVGGLDLLGENLPELTCKIGRGIRTPYESVSVALGEKIIHRAMELQAEYIICQDYPCLMHLQGIIDKRQIPLKTIHLVDVLASGWPNI